MIKTSTDTKGIKRSMNFISPLVWTPEISTNNENIDEQHQELFAITNELIEHADASAKSEVVNEILYKLLQYIEVHFNEEEELLSQVNYPQLQEHKALHRGFTKKIALFCKDVVRGRAYISDELLLYLTSWIIQHISINDQDYKNYV